MDTAIRSTGTYQSSRKRSFTKSHVSFDIFEDAGVVSKSPLEGHAGSAIELPAPKRPLVRRILQPRLHTPNSQPACSTDGNDLLALKARDNLFFNLYHLPSHVGNKENLATATPQGDISTSIKPTSAMYIVKRTVQSQGLANGGAQSRRILHSMLQVRVQQEDDSGSKCDRVDAGSPKSRRSKKARTIADLPFRQAVHAQK
ncbi:hypothetical protein NX059_012408 [Plenodomus lindquistii]|nr:hypothetical protein NX059_012408 [Plenodomus lindquistii]